MKMRKKAAKRFQQDRVDKVIARLRRQQVNHENLLMDHGREAYIERMGIDPVEELGRVDAEYQGFVCVGNAAEEPAVDTAADDEARDTRIDQFWASRHRS